MDELLSFVAHELKAPLSTMIMRAERIGSNGTDIEMLRGLRAIVVRHAWHMVRLIDDMVYLTKIDGGSIAITPVVLDVIAVVRETVERIGPTFGDHHINVRASGSLAAPLDVARIGQVITDLIASAAMSSPADTTIDVLVEELPDAARVYVRHPVEIPLEALPYVFQPYDQVEKRHRGPGMGLGLYVCRHLVELHGGSVGVDSAPGRGTSFWFTLPKA